MAHSKKNTKKIVNRLANMVRRHNQELALDALLKAGFGVVLSVIVFGIIFWGGWVVGWSIARSLHLEPWQFGALLAFLFLGTATWSAWHRVDPLAGLRRMTDRQWMQTMI